VDDFDLSISLPGFRPELEQGVPKSCKSCSKLSIGLAPVLKRREKGTEKERTFDTPRFYCAENKESGF